MIEVGGRNWRVSPLLGERAACVYESFLRALERPGDVAECGCHEGVTAAEMARCLDEQGSRRRVHLFDTFSGLPPIITEWEQRLSTWEGLAPRAYACLEAQARETVRSLSGCVLHPGPFDETFAAFDRPLCFIHADADLYASTVATIRLAERLLVAGGIILFDDYGNPRLPGVEIAVDKCLDREQFAGRRLPGSIQYVAIRRGA
jgi:O-methyltransferase